MELDCQICGKVIEYCTVDGYTFGENQLQDVNFKVFVKDDGKLGIEYLPDVTTTKSGVTIGGTSWQDDPYLCTLNEAYWMKMAEDWVERGFDGGVCPHCNEDAAGVKEDE